MRPRALRQEAPPGLKNGLIRKMRASLCRLRDSATSFGLAPRIMHTSKPKPVSGSRLAGAELIDPIRSKLHQSNALMVRAFCRNEEGTNSTDFPRLDLRGS
jgi:hypothetical protein